MLLKCDACTDACVGLDVFSSMDERANCSHLQNRKPFTGTKYADGRNASPEYQILSLFPILCIVRVATRRVFVGQHSCVCRCRLFVPHRFNMQKIASFDETRREYQLQFTLCTLSTVFYQNTFYRLILSKSTNQRLKAAQNNFVMPVM